MIATTESTARTDLLRWDGEVDEPYMFIPRFPDIRMTPWREEDADAAVSVAMTSDLLELIRIGETV